MTKSKNSQKTFTGLRPDTEMRFIEVVEYLLPLITEVSEGDRFGERCPHNIFSMKPLLNELRGAGFITIKAAPGHSWVTYVYTKKGAKMANEWLLIKSL